MARSIYGIIVLTLLVLSTTTNAALIECGSTQRVGTLDSATLCVTGLGNPKVADINAEFSSTTGWTNAGELTGDGNNGSLTASLTSGSWGSSPIEGTWDIASSFWDLYGQAVISIHVGNGGGDPDYFAWLVEDGETAGTWSYEKLFGGGGGLSNIKLWGSDGPARVPEPSIIALLAVGLLGLGFARRRKA